MASTTHQIQLEIIITDIKIPMNGIKQPIKAFTNKMKDIYPFYTKWIHIE
jgi:hypothetical protein